MMACWSKKAQERPTFGDIAIIISNYAEVIAGYLDINFNPFESFGSQAVSTAASAINIDPLDSPDYEKDIGESSSLLLRKLEDSNQKLPKKCKSPKSTTASPKVSPKGSPRPSPRVSPRNSPRASPLLKLKKLKGDHQCSPAMSGAEIEICIKSPSEDGSDTSSSELLWMK